VCRRVLIIDDGRLVADGTPDELRGAATGTAELQVELEAPQADAQVALAALPGVAKVSSQGNGRFRISQDGANDLRREVFRLAVEKGWTLLELRQTTPSLEDVFLRLTMRDTTAPAAAEEEEVHA